MFTAASSDAGVVIRMQRRGLLRRAIVPVTEWLSSSHGNEGRVASFLLARLQDGSAQPDGPTTAPTGIVIPHDLVVTLPATVANAVGLPPLASLSITLTFEGLMTDPGGYIRCRWYDENTFAVRPQRNGSMVRWGEREGRLSATLYRLIQAVDAYNATDGREAALRIAAWGPVQDSYRSITGNEAHADDYLGHLTVYQAGAMALDVRQGSDGPDFVPIVMRRERSLAAADDEASVPEEAEDPNAYGRLRDDVVDALLPRELQQEFVTRFVREPQTRPAYVLGRQQFLVIEPELRTALDVVRAMRSARRTEREEFARNPRPRIARALECAIGKDRAADMSDAGSGDRFDAPEPFALASHLLVETHQYAERVLGLGLWEKPRLPWLKTPSGQWMPERFPMKIGGTTIEMGQEEALQIRTDHAAAIAAGRDEVVIQGYPLPTHDVGVMLTELGLMEDVPPPPSDDAVPPEAAAAETTNKAEMVSPHTTTETTDRRVLLIRQNFDGVDYLMHWPARAPLTLATSPGDGSVRTAPKPHQEEGFRWLADAWSAGWPGVLLADDMGLGKTFQALSFLAWLREERHQQERGVGAMHQPMLVVAPTALLRNWIEESERHLKPHALGERVDAFGSALARLKTPRGTGWSEEDSLDVDQLRRADWILTTYETLANHHRAFARVAFSIALFDEAQKIKTPGTINTQAAKAMNADFTLALTGTPIETRLADLWCIMDRVVPGYLGDLRGFVARYEEGGEEELDDLRRRLDRPNPRTPAPLLRRLKEDILADLPKRHVCRTRSDMPPSQAQAYDEARQMALRGGRGHGDMLRAIHAFRGISLHPDGADGVDPFDPVSVRHWASRSARLTQAVAALERIRAAGEKALVFLEDRGMQDAFASAMATHFQLAVPPAVINGEVPGEKRLAIVDAFQREREGFGLLVLSPKAAGVGLTITAANHVIHLSRWWNPAVEDQCNDRCYRMGQSRPVTIHIPLAIHPSFRERSFDVTLDDLLERRRALSRHMLRAPVEDGDVELLFGQAVDLSS